MARRLKESQKIELVEGYREGQSSSSLASQFGCSINTVNRVVKGILTKEEYLEVKKSRGKIKSNKGEESISSNKDQVDIGLLNSQKEHNLPEDNLINTDIKIKDNNFISSGFIKVEKDLDNSSIFKEVVPLISDFGFENNKQKIAIKPLKPEILPQTVFMLVNQKVELEPKQIKDFPEWNFLPPEEQDRQAILLFENQRTAKRNCSRGQRVIKVPDSDVFIITSSFLLSKGITRLIFDDQLISID